MSPKMRYATRSLQMFCPTCGYMITVNWRPAKRAWIINRHLWRHKTSRRRMLCPSSLKPLDYPAHHTEVQP